MNAVVYPAAIIDPSGLQYRAEVSAAENILYGFKGRTEAQRLIHNDARSGCFSDGLGDQFKLGFIYADRFFDNDERRRPRRCKDPADDIRMGVIGRRDGY